MNTTTAATAGRTTSANTTPSSETAYGTLKTPAPTAQFARLNVDTKNEASRITGAVLVGEATTRGASSSSPSSFSANTSFKPVSIPPTQSRTR